MEVHSIAEVRGESQTIDDDIKPLAEALPLGVFLQVQGEEHHEDVEGVGIGNGGGVEIDAAPEDIPELRRTEHVFVGAVVLQQEGDPGHHIGCIQKQNIDDHCPQPRYLVFTIHYSLFVIH